MTTEGEGAAAQNARRPTLDDIDRSILEVVANDGRATVADIASRAGIAASTAHARLRRLISEGTITGFHAAIDQRDLGLQLQALVGVTLRPGARQENIVAFANAIRGLPDVIQIFFVGGADDFIVHVAVPDSSALRTFVVQHLSGQPSVASTRTSIVFDYHRNRVASSFQ
ncbi:Lrp/AsnC family transcriptional regulator [Antiquaquibacter oligotrophicus]|nr:Lrp/AsnC family transcriptional regulator [Antiquaquibacter oligotrophicus]UDF14579.1 Lrp/AsnC family transcriptional regulator [Antiquaquibacter oligotrophicus]